jgi:chromosome segregation ATPase
MVELFVVAGALLVFGFIALICILGADECEKKNEALEEVKLLKKKLVDAEDIWKKYQQSESQIKVLTREVTLAEEEINRLVRVKEHHEQTLEQLRIQIRKYEEDIDSPEVKDLQDTIEKMRLRHAEELSIVEENRYDLNKVIEGISKELRLAAGRLDGLCIPFWPTKKGGSK